MIRNLIFDFGKVLVDYDVPAVMRTFFDSEADMERFCSACLHADAMASQDRGDKPWGELLEDMRRACPDFEAQVDMFDKRYQEFIIGEMPGMKALMKDLKAKGYRLFGLTNWSVKVYGTMDAYPEIFSLLDDRIVSSEEHLIKPDPAIYQRLVDKFSLKAEECLFADDRPENIEGCRKVGMDGVLFTTTEKFIEDLKSRGVL